jgi:hypothetical protein
MYSLSFNDGHKRKKRQQFTVLKCRATGGFRQSHPSQHIPAEIISGI